jgi:hypothetical protein
MLPSEAVPDEVSVVLVVDGVDGVASKAVAWAGTVLGQRSLLRGSSSSMPEKLLLSASRKDNKLTTGKSPRPRVGQC